MALALAARAGRIPGPRLYTAGLGFSHPDNGFPPGRPINRPVTAAEARELVRGLAGQGAHFVKMWVDVAPPAAPAAITPEMRTAIVEEVMTKSSDAAGFRAGRQSALSGAGFRITCSWNGPAVPMFPSTG